MKLFVSHVRLTRKEEQNKKDMKKLFIIALVAAFALPSCSTTDSENGKRFSIEMLSKNKDTDKKISKAVSVKPFVDVVLKGSDDIVFTQTAGGSPRVTIVGHQDVVDKTIVESDGKTLTVSRQSAKGDYSMKNIFGSTDNGVTVYVSAPDLTGVTIKGSGDFSCDGSVDTDVMDVKLLGSGDIKIGSMICDELHVSLKGSGDVDMKDVTVQQDAQMEVIGSGDLEMGQLFVKGDTEIKLNGSGDIDVNFVKSGSVNCSLLGSGDISLKGDVRNLAKHVKGSGDVHVSGLQVRK